MASNIRSKVLIVGSGPTGLIAALTLTKNGVPVRVIEKSPTNRIGQRGAGILARSYEVFESLGFLDEVMKRSIPLPRARLYKPVGGTEVVPIGEFEISPSFPSTPACPYMSPRVLGQDNLDKILRFELEKYGVTVEFGVELQALEDSGDEVSVKLQRTGGEAEEATYQYVIGADGAKSTVRKQLGLPFRGESIEQKLIVGDVNIDGLDDGKWHIFGDMTDKIASLRPTEVPRLFNFFLAGSNLDAEDIVSSESKVRDFMAQNTKSLGKGMRIMDFICFSLYKVHSRMVETLQKGRCFVLGDAAHIHPPTGGQGMNTGIQDSYNLGWKLALVLNGLANPALLSTLSEERIPVIREMLDFTTGYMKKTLLNNAATATDFKRRTTDNQLGINYRSSSIVMDDGISKQEAMKTCPYGGTEGIVCAGDRAPDAPGLVLVGDESDLIVRLHQLFRPTHHTVLVFVDKDADVFQIEHSIFSKYPPELVSFIILLSRDRQLPHSISAAVYEDRDGHAYTAYAGPSASSSVFVIRPDGYIGARLGCLDKIEAYFKGIFMAT